MTRHTLHLEHASPVAAGMQAVLYFRACALYLGTTPSFTDLEEPLRTLEAPKDGRGGGCHTEVGCSSGAT